MKGYRCLSRNRCGGRPALGEERDARPSRGSVHRADTGEIRRWLAQEAHMPAPAHIATGNSEISAALKESISIVRRQKRAL